MSAFDVIEVEIAAPHRVRVIATGKSLGTSENIIHIAVARRGVEHHFFTAAPAGKYKDGDFLEQVAPSTKGEG